MTLKIAQLGEPVLREKAREVTTEEIVSPEFQALLRDMEETMTASSGVGLAAPQVFDGRRVFLARIVPTENEDELPGVEVFINPRFITVSDEMTSAWEGCLSFIELTVKVPRHRMVVVEYLDSGGKAKRLELTDFPARVVQHENDHLDGILTIDRAASTRDIFKTSVLQEMMERKRAEEAKDSSDDAME